MKIWFNQAAVEFVAAENGDIIQQSTIREGNTEEEIDKMIMLELRKKLTEEKNIKKPLVKNPKKGDIIERGRLEVDIKNIISKAIIFLDRVKDLKNGTRSYK